MIHLDGSIGEGGGQILRTALSLSLITGQPFRIDNIRAGRARPGLLRQHLTAVLAAGEVGAATLSGATLGSSSLTFVPGVVTPGEFTFRVGSAGSTTLVLQTVLPPLMLAAAPSRITLEGGTHNEAAPPFHYLAEVFLPLLARMGPRVAITLDRYGFFPAGGGQFVATIQPVPALTPLALPPRGAITSRQLHVILAKLRRHIAEREIAAATATLGWPADQDVNIEFTNHSLSPGNLLMIKLTSGDLTEIFSGFGKLGVTAEQIGQQVAAEASDYLASTAAVSEHLADQLLLPLALAGSGSFTTVKLNDHATTNMAVISRFLPVRFSSTPGEGHTVVRVN